MWPCMFQTAAWQNVTCNVYFVGGRSCRIPEQETFYPSKHLSSIGLPYGILLGRVSA